VEKLLTIQQLSDLIQISPKTIYQWTHIGFIPHYKFPKGIRFYEEEILAWLKKRKAGGRKQMKLNVDHLSQI
jgi:excisionase family DNA binding protein